MVTNDPIWQTMLPLGFEFGTVTLSGDRLQVEQDLDEVYAGGGQSAGCLSQFGSTVVVTTPSPESAASIFLIQHLRREPQLFADRWQTAGQTSIAVRSQAIIASAPTSEVHEFSLPNGLYGIRVSGAGFVDQSKSDISRVSDWWQVQLWSIVAEQALVELACNSSNPGSVIARPAWASLAATTDTEPTDPWRSLRPLLRQFAGARRNRYRARSATDFVNSLPLRWRRFDSEVIINRLSNYIDDGEPLRVWTSEELESIRTNFGDLHEYLPEVSAGNRDFFALMDQIGQRTLRILDRLYPRAVDQLPGPSRPGEEHRGR